MSCKRLFSFLAVLFTLIIQKEKKKKEKKNVGESVVTRIEGRNVWLLAINERGRDTTPSAVKWLAVKQKIV